MTFHFFLLKSTYKLGDSVWHFLHIGHYALFLSIFLRFFPGALGGVSGRAIRDRYTWMACFNFIILDKNTISMHQNLKEKPFSVYHLAIYGKHNDIWGRLYYLCKLIVLVCNMVCISLIPNGEKFARLFILLLSSPCKVWGQVSTVDVYALSSQSVQLYLSLYCVSQAPSSLISALSTDHGHPVS